MGARREHKGGRKGGGARSSNLHDRRAAAPKNQTPKEPRAGTQTARHTASATHQAVELPAGIADLGTGLAKVDGDCLSHGSAVGGGAGEGEQCA